MERVNSALYRFLSGCLPVKVKVYPGIADEDAKFPYVVYNQESFETKRTKDGVYRIEFRYVVDVWSDSFNESDSCATSVVFQSFAAGVVCLEDPSGCLRIVLKDGSSDYSEGGFVQRLSFDVAYEGDDLCVRSL